MRSIEQTNAEAAGWLDRMNRSAFDSVEGARFDEWMRADPRNREAFAEMAALWDDRLLEQACVAVREAPATEGVAARAVRRPLSRPRRWLPLAASAAAAAVAALLFIPAIPVSHQTAPGVTRTVALSDGTTLSLGGNSAVTVRYWPWRREVELTRGEAGFDVSHSSWRSFEVDAGSVRIGVLGTAFHVDRFSQHRVSVAVARGKVRLTDAASQLDLAAGEAALASDSVLRRIPMDPEHVRPGSEWFVMRDAPLGDLVAKMRRFSDASIAVDGTLADDLRLTGRFRVSATEETLALLRKGYGLDIARDGDVIRIE